MCLQRAVRIVAQDAGALQRMETIMYYAIAAIAVSAEEPVEAWPLLDSAYWASKALVQRAAILDVVSGWCCDV